MMTTERPESAEGQGTRLCRAGSKGPNPCWRPATTNAYEGEPEISYCAFHAELIRRIDERYDLLATLYIMQDWIAGPVKASEDDDLKSYAYTMRDKAEEDLWPAMVAQKAASLIAGQRQDEKPLAPEQAQRLAVLLLRCDALSDARAILEGLPEEAFGTSDRWAITAALMIMSEEANAEASRYKREIGLGEQESTVRD
jgi:hypothetical protein